jgi:hypothetical protein
VFSLKEILINPNFSKTKKYYEVYCGVIALFSIQQTDLTSFSEGGLRGAQEKFHIDLGGGLL